MKAQVYNELPVTGPALYRPTDIQVLPGMQFRRGHNDENGLSGNDPIVAYGPEGIDLSRIGVLTVWVTREGVAYVVDGHHRLYLCKIHQQVQIGVQRLQGADFVIPCFELRESDGWTKATAKAYGKQINEMARPSHWTNADSISQEDRDKLPETDFAGPHRSFPIRNQKDVEDAARLIGHAEKPEAVKAKIEAIATRKGLSLPKSWAMGDGYIPQDEYDQIPDEDFAGPDRTFPIRNQEDLQNRSYLIGHSKNPEEVKAKAIEIAHRKGLSLPEAWSKGEKLKEKNKGDSAGEVTVRDDAPCNCTDVISTAVDSVKGGLMQVRQLATIADVKNKNGRIYPRKVLQDAVDRARPLIRAGAINSEREHPEIVNVCDRGQCGDAFVTNPELVTARIDDFTDVDADGNVHVIRTILDTPEGRKVAAKIKAGKPEGVSIRLKMRSSYDSNKHADVATWLRIDGLDDVTDPAVPTAGTIADGASKADSAEDVPTQGFGVRQPQTEENGLGAPFLGNAPNNTVNPPTKGTSKAVREIEEGREADSGVRPVSAKDNKMDKLTPIASVRKFHSSVKSGKNIAEITANEQAACDSILTEYHAGGNVADAVATFQATHAYVDASGTRIAGFVPGKTGPYATLASEMGDDPASGWGKDYKSGSGLGRLLGATAQTTKTGVKPMSATLKGDAKAKDDMGMDSEEEDEKDMTPKAENDEDEGEETFEDKFGKSVKDESHPFNKMGDSEREELKNFVKKHAKADSDISKMVEDACAMFGKKSADSKLATAGLGSLPKGSTVNDASHPRSEVVFEHRPGAAQVNRLLTEGDSIMRNTVGSAFGGLNPDNPDVKSQRKRNRAALEPLMDGFAEKMYGRDGIAQAFVAKDSTDDGFLSSVSKIVTARDSFAGTTSNLLNQPTVFQTLLVQAFQDLRCLDFVQAIGPGTQTNGTASGWDMQHGFGSVFKVPYESYTDPANYGFEYNNIDYGLLFPNTSQGIDEGTVNVYWDTFFPNWRFNATSNDIQSINSLGRGPLNYPVIARQLLHMAYRKSRTIDTALANEFPDIAFEYGAVAVATETYTTGNGRLANNSVLPASGAVSVNLNPTKTAVATIASTDKSITYGLGNSSGGVAVIAAIRMLCGTTGSIGGTTTYCGSSNIYGPTPVVRPRAQQTLNSQGQVTTSTLNPIAITAPAAAVLGVLGSDGNIYSTPGTTATYAIDFINGVIVFASGVVGAAGIMTTTVTFSSYSYATNFDYFVASPNMVTIPTGSSYQAVMNGLITQFDATAANMGSWSKFVAPDLGLMSLKVSTLITQATLFYKLNSPDGTELYPNEKEFARRNGVAMARFNAPWWIQDSAIILTRSGSEKYAIDTPFEVRGPFAKYDSSQRLQAGEAYYAAENSAICTPQVKSAAGTIINPCSRAILIY